MKDVCICFRRFHYIYLSTNIKNVPRMLVIFFKTLVYVLDIVCFKTLVTLLVIVSKRWLLCWILFTNVGYYVGYCFRILVNMLANVYNVFCLSQIWVCTCKRIGKFTSVPVHAISVLIALCATASDKHLC